jgi:serine/threonine protein kinase
MEYAYSKGIDAHRDIKPDNIMISADKTVKITDFGLVKVSEGIQLKEDIVSIGKNPSLSVFQSKGRHICGTLPYMAPEQFDGYADKRSDIYAFGIVLYQMVSGGKLPFVGRSGQEYEKLHRYGRVPSTSSQVSPVLQNCLEKNPSRRYQDFDTIREKLQRLLLKETGEAIISPQDEEFTAQELYNRGLSFWTFCRYQEALPFFDKAIDKKLNEPELYVIKIQSLLKLGKKYEAVSCYVETMKETHLPLSSKIMINILVVLCIFLWPPSLFGFIFGSIYYVLNKGWTYLIRVTKWLR